MKRRQLLRYLRSHGCELLREGGMAELMDRITVNPEQCGGRPCIRGMRVRVSDVLDLLANNLSPEEIIKEMPDLELEDVYASLRFASRRLDHPPDSPV